MRRARYPAPSARRAARRAGARASVGGSSSSRSRASEADLAAARGDRVAGGAVHEDAERRGVDGREALREQRRRRRRRARRPCRRDAMPGLPVGLIQRGRPGAAIDRARALQHDDAPRSRARSARAAPTRSRLHRGRVACRAGAPSRPGCGVSTVRRRRARAGAPVAARRTLSASASRTSGSRRVPHDRARRARASRRRCRARAARRPRALPASSASTARAVAERGGAVAVVGQRRGHRLEHARRRRSAAATPGTPSVTSPAPARAAPRAPRAAPRRSCRASRRSRARGRTSPLCASRRRGAAASAPTVARLEQRRVAGRRAATRRRRRCRCRRPRARPA